MIGRKKVWVARKANYISTQLFPGLGDYLALASAPVRLRELFAAKFSALVAFAGLFIFSATFLPSVAMPSVMAGRHVPDAVRQAPAIFVSTTAAGWFVFFALVTAQGRCSTLLRRVISPAFRSRRKGRY